MDKELHFFIASLKASRNYKSLIWFFIFLWKTIMDKISRKFFKTKPTQVSVERVDIQCTGRICELSMLHREYHDRSDLQKTIKDNINWDAHTLDIQDLHLLHRFRELPVGFDLNRIEQIKDWVANNPMASLPGWHPYTLSERVIHWCWSLSFYRGSIGTAELKVIQKSLLLQVYYLRNNFEFHLGHHNHLINNARALLTAATLLTDDTEAEDWKKYALKIFNEEWPYQLLPDGVHVEQSVTYHFLLTRTLWEMKQLAEQNGCDFLFDDDLKKMIRYARIIVRPDGTIPFLGHITPDWHWKELVGLLPVWGYTELPISELGKCYKQSPPIGEAEPEGVFLFPEAGQGIIRKSNIHLVLSCDPRFLITPHGDQNPLGIDLWLEDTHLIWDAGLNSYNLDADRAWYESWKGQSTFIIDGLDPIVSNWRKRQLPKAYYKAMGSVKTLEGGVVATHTGYCRLPDPVVASRSVRYRDGVITIEDVVGGAVAHNYEAKFHLGPNRISQSFNRGFEIKDPQTNKRFLFTWEADLQVVQEQNNYSIAYGIQEKGTSLAIKFSVTGNSTIRYSIQSIQ